MTLNRLGRGMTAVIVSANCLALLTSTAASAAPPVTGNGVDVWLSAGTATPLARCLTDAQDGTVTTRLADCRRVRQSGGTLRLGGSTVWVFPAGGRRPILHRTDTDVTVSGPIAVAVNRRVEDAQDGVVDQRNACTQVAAAGNAVRMFGVTIVVTR